MKFSVNALDFKNALKGCEKTVSKDDTRQVLQYVQVVAKDSAVTLTALDGFRMVQYSLATKGEFTPGEALIPPKLALLALHNSKKNASVEIEADHMRVVTDLAITIALPHIEGQYIQHEKLWPDPTRKQAHIGINPKLLLQTVQALDMNNGMICLDVPLDPTAPITITAGGGTCSRRGMVLPIRIGAPHHAAV